MYFVYLTISTSETCFQYSIYGNFPQTNLAILNNSDHPSQHNMAAFNYLLYQNLRISLNDKEKSIIKQPIWIRTKNQKLENKGKRKLTTQIT